MEKTTLRESYVFGPIKSRRLGVSLGINVLPIETKICNFNCIYCECGWNRIGQPKIKKAFPTNEVIRLELKQVLTKIQNNNTKIDSITFSGNGEPTLNPNFAKIIEDTIKIRNEIMPSAAISVLSNATNLNKTDVVEALKKINNPILKLDSTNIETFEMINLANINNNNISIAKIIDGMKLFDGNFIFQIMFLRGKINGNIIDNTTETEIAGLIEAIKITNPRQVMIYSIDRETPAKDLVKLNANEMCCIENTIKNAGFNVLSV